MTKYEKETIIVFNEEGKDLEIETPNKTLQAKIEDLGIEADRSRYKDDTEFKTYIFPKKWLRFRKPRELSSEMRQVYAQRARENFGR